MSASDLVDRLIDLLHTEAVALDELRAAMQSGRTAWLALRPADLQDTIEQLQKMAQGSAAFAERRGAVLRDLAEALDLPENSNVSRLTSRLPNPLAVRLRDAAGRAAKAAHAVRQESGMGGRLLDFARQSQESLLHLLGQPGDSHARSYDRNAKAVVHATAAGSFVDGRL